jgi:hypothetical protein
MCIRRLALISFLLTIVLVSSAAFALSTSWHDLSQSERNQRILSDGHEDLNDDVGVSCKIWVRNIVREASGNLVTIPSTKSNGYQWYSHPDVYAVPQPSPVEWVTPGCIIQMKWRNQNGTTYPHTAIVVSKNSSGMTWIDSNWNGDQVVRTHFVSYSQFYTAVQGYRYTLYYIE